MTDLGEDISPNVETPPEQTEEVKKIKIRFSLFFDGTLNNRTNVQSRNDNSDSYNQAIQSRSNNWWLLRDLKGTVSYENDYSNVARMSEHIKNSVEGYDKYYFEYIEGQGTYDNEADGFIGKALGTGSSGVELRAKKGVEKIRLKIQNEFDSDTEIEKFDIDVFGFSRGAAAARHFIFQATNTTVSESGFWFDRSLKKQLENSGFKVYEIKYVFAGLYDTVSSIGPPILHRLNNWAARMDAIEIVENVVQLAASEEHRENFSLTNIDSAGSKGKQVFLPGVHSDIGGGYRDTSAMEETDREIKKYYLPDRSQSKTAAEAEMQRLVAAGWFEEEDIWVASNKKDGERARGPRYWWVEAKDRKVKNTYDRIPLHIMADFARQSGVGFSSRLETKEPVPEELNQLKSSLKSYAQSGNSKIEDWHGNSEQLIFLRRKYLHFSANCSDTGMGPRMVNGKRTRLVYDG